MGPKPKPGKNQNDPKNQIYGGSSSGSRHVFPDGCIWVDHFDRCQGCQVDDCPSDLDHDPGGGDDPGGGNGSGSFESTTDAVDVRLSRMFSRLPFFNHNAIESSTSSANAETASMTDASNLDVGG